MGRKLENWNHLQPSSRSQVTMNPIRSYVEIKIANANISDYYKQLVEIKENPDPQRPQNLINVSIGDPSIYKDFKPNPDALKYVSENIGIYDGYTDSRGSLQVRQYLAKDYSETLNLNVTENDIFCTQGVTMAMWLAICVMCDTGDNFLVPAPGFPLAIAMAQNRGINVKNYQLNSSQEIDLQDLENKIDERTKFILVNNVSNPLGTVWRAEHVKEIADFAQKHNLLIVSDETYEYFTYSDQKYISFSQYSGDVPVILLSGLSKRYLVPGWRFGWLILCGKPDYFTQIKRGLNNLTSMIGHPNTIIMPLVQQIKEINKLFSPKKFEQIGERFSLLQQKFNDIRGIKILNSQGAMYAGIHILFDQFKDIQDSEDFAIKLYQEKNVMALPGSLFNGNNFIRIVLCADKDVIIECSDRIIEFCQNHYN